MTTEPNPYSSPEISHETSFSSDTVIGLPHGLPGRLGVGLLGGVFGIVALFSLGMFAFHAPIHSADRSIVRTCPANVGICAPYSRRRIVDRELAAISLLCGHWQDLDERRSSYCSATTWGTMELERDRDPFSLGLLHRICDRGVRWGLILRSPNKTVFPMASTHTIHGTVSGSKA